MARRTNLPAPPGMAADGAGLERLDGPEAAARLYALAGAEEEGRGLLLHGADLSGEALDGLTLPPDRGRAAAGGFHRLPAPPVRPVGGAVV